MWRSLSIRGKLTTVIGGGLVVSVLLSTLISNISMRSVLSDRINQEEIPATLASIANAIEKEISIPMAISQGMADNTFVLNWIEQGESEDQLKQQADYLAGVKQTTGAVSAFLISEKSNRYYTEAGHVRTLSKNSSNDRWFYDFLLSGKKASLDLDSATGQGGLTLFVNYRLGNYAGITGVGFAVDQISQLVRQYTIGDTGFVYLVDGDGVVQIHKESSKVKQATLQTEIKDKQAAAQLLDQQNVQVINLGDRIVSTKFIPSLNWYLVAELPTEEIFSVVNATSLNLTLMNILVATVLIVFGVWVAITLARPIKSTAGMLDNIANGDADLTQTLDVQSEDELGQLSNAFNRFMKNLKDIISTVVLNADVVRTSVSEVSQAARKSNENALEQQKSIESIATAINEVSATAQDISGNASKTAEAAKHSSNQSFEGKSVVEKAVSGINSLQMEVHSASDVIGELVNEIEHIGSILEVIRGISDQTNLLALNAAIEAARAGEHGRGFSVVASEVRELAQRTQTSTEEITGMIAKLQSGADNAVTAMTSGMNKAEDAVKLADQAGNAFSNITESIASISDLSLLVATATEEQSSVADELNRHINTIQSMAEQTAVESLQTFETCEELNKASHNLNDLVSNFKL